MSTLSTSFAESVMAELSDNSWSVYFFTFISDKYVFCSWNQVPAKILAADCVTLRIID